MSYFCHNPRLGGQFQFGRSVFSRDANAQVPKSGPVGFGHSFEYHDDGLHTPNQNIPMPVASQCRNQNMTRFGENEWNPNGYRWRDMSRRFSGDGGSWNEPQYFDPSRPMESSLGFSRDDIEYAKISDTKNAEMFQNMGTRQKRLLNALEYGRLFRLSRLKLDRNPR